MEGLVSQVRCGTGPYEETDMKTALKQKNLGSSPDGKQADSPEEFGTTAWKQVMLRTFRELKNDNISVVAAGVAFYALLSIIPGLTALVGIYGIFADSVHVQELISQLAGSLSPDAKVLLEEQLHKITMKEDAAGLSAVVGTLIAIWSGSKAIKALIEALNIAYDENDTRGFFKINLTIFLLTLASLITAVIAIGLIALLPVVFENMRLPKMLETGLSICRWPIMGGFAMIGLAFLYTFGPNRSPPKWRWVTPGALLATFLWLCGSYLFSVYITHFGKIGETYGSMGAVVILLLWFNLSAFLVLLGAEINAEMEHQTCKDTTRGREKPMGKRRASVADTVAIDPLRYRMTG